MDAEKRELLIDRFRLAGFVEACRLYQEGIATVKDIDLAMLAGAGFVKGPFAWADEVGLDVVLGKLEGLCQRYGEAFEPPPLLKEMVARGHLGRKSGRGFYEY
ncbi:MAG: hypothetical protein K6T75_02575 [Acetobacteraceae bacterium]|nr:hypothetical protein [Acetobacteraceae bacterium]